MPCPWASSSGGDSNNNNTTWVRQWPINSGGGMKAGQTSLVQKGMRGYCVSNREGSRWSFKHFLKQFVVEVELPWRATE
jgi:hypothetical protein